MAQPTYSAEAANQERSLNPDQSREVALAEEVFDCVRDYARQRPEIIALWCFGIGFVLGWKLKPW